MNTRNQLYCAYCGWIFMILFLGGWGIVGGFIPPPDPADSAETVAKRFAEDRNSIRFGILMCLFGAALILPWCAAIVTQVKRIEGRYSPVAWIQLSAGACLVIEFTLPLMSWATAAYRQDTSDEFVQRLNDLAWLPFLGAAMTTIISAVTLGIVVLQDKRETPIFPRWFGYYSIWLGMLISPAGLIIFFKDGPLAWNGIISFWMVFAVFTAWVSALTILMTQAIKRQGREGFDEMDDPEIARLTAELELVKTQVTSLTEESRQLSANQVRRSQQR